ncbi:hypothetical protein [Pectobacterium peruviense]|uniref:hypothetical protein n=1 Tax=Pectobacterium peruviense TaxID=2066479 RepID=UPI0012FE812A
MRKARSTEHQIIAMSKSAEARRTVKNVCRGSSFASISVFRSGETRFICHSMPSN